MKKLILTALILTGCDKFYPLGPDALVFGDRVFVTAGKYKGSKAQIDEILDDKFKAECQFHKYHAGITRHGISTHDYLCHENLMGMLTTEWED